MNTKTGEPHQHICHRDPRPCPTDDPESILESLRAHVHLIDADAAPHADVMLSSNHVESIVNRVNIGAALERRVATVSERPIPTPCDLRGCQPATAAVACLIGAAPRATNVGTRNSQCCRFARSRALRGDVIENPVVPEAELVHAGW